MHLICPVAVLLGKSLLVIECLVSPFGQVENIAVRPIGVYIEERIVQAVRVEIGRLRFAYMDITFPVFLPAIRYS